MERDGAYLLDMLLAARDAVEIVGEAASHVSSGMRESQSNISWGEIVGMRNRLVHVYFDIDIGLVWRTVKEDLPTLIVQLEDIAAAEDLS